MNPPVPTSPTFLPRTRVLVLDDEDLIGKVFSRVLSDQHEVVALTNPRAALALIEAGQHFDAVFCDVLMPTMCAWEFLDRVRAVAPDLVARTVFLSGGAFTPQAVAFARAQRDRLVEKPVEPQVLREIAARLVAR